MKINNKKYTFINYRIKKEGNDNEENNRTDIEEEKKYSKEFTKLYTELSQVEMGQVNGIEEEYENEIYRIDKKLYWIKTILYRFSSSN
ncbi:uncharacterized protein OCT59_012704 [Rhizophagus irregularis]|uniref:uncharacterized protein n=1 Tax=Rhizophagus irregularis TaxID=588596 RepID=UPI0033283EC5|nr:hypothetical protein OCT59_012704 [Rhizophagus irregularis]